VDRLLLCAALLGGLVIMLTVPALAQKPDPFRLQPEPFVGPAAVPVMEQVFFVQINQPPGAPVQATCPEGVRLLDQTLIYDHGVGDEAMLYNNVFLRIENGQPRQEGAAKVQGL
jgi:hypothetical protein